MPDKILLSLNTLYNEEALEEIDEIERGLFVF
jgi:hypothetical protein